MFKSSDSGFAGDGGKVIKELIKSLATFEVIQECLERHAGILEYRFSAKNSPDLSR